MIILPLRISKPAARASTCDTAEMDRRCFNEKTIRGSCADYRACATCDFEMDSADRDKKIACPLLVLWGTRSHTGRVYGDGLGIWKDYALNVTGGPIECGHYVNEEAPDEIFEGFVRFFSG